MKWVSFHHSTGVATCEIFAVCSELTDCNSKVVNGFSAPFKLKNFKKHGKSFEHFKCIEANNALSAPESTACMKKFDQKILRAHEVCFHSAV
jgi:hypothetical protein